MTGDRSGPWSEPHWEASSVFSAGRPVSAIGAAVGFVGGAAVDLNKAQDW